MEDDLTSRVTPGRLRQVVVAVFVLAGLLGMHGLSSGHGSASPAGMFMPGQAKPSPALPTPIPATLGNATPDLASHVTTAAMLIVTEAASGSRMFAVPGSEMTGMLLTCLAILPGGRLLGLPYLLLIGRLASQREHPARPTGRPIRSTRWLTPAPDLVAGLCVSRT